MRFESNSSLQPSCHTARRPRARHRDEGSRWASAVFRQSCGAKACGTRFCDALRLRPDCPAALARAGETQARTWLLSDCKHFDYKLGDVCLGYMPGATERPGK